GQQHYHPHDERIEADYSQAAFYLVADTLGSEVTLRDLNPHSKQGDCAILDFLVSMGASWSFNEEGLIIKADELNAIDIDASQQPDLMPVMSVACAYAKGVSHIYNARRLRLKECDRLEAIAKMLKKAGIEVEETEDSLTITGGQVRGCHVTTMHDHRMAMSAAVLALKAEGNIVIDDYECVKKSYPDFFLHYKKLGGNTHEC
ncbi:MAG: 3-phosphoshikimate 1-carboxyvinyltransferase, partial [Erysipelotrichaceae bacterium]|nr:3-phosphoshikimate 1-carboxyvinyltransferase [Erysipelotrichaceae bacterium]